MNFEEKANNFSRHVLQCSQPRHLLTTGRIPISPNIGITQRCVINYLQPLAISLLSTHRATKQRKRSLKIKHHFFQRLKGNKNLPKKTQHYYLFKTSVDIISINTMLRQVPFKPSTFRQMFRWMFFWFDSHVSSGNVDTCCINLTFFICTF